MKICSKCKAEKELVDFGITYRGYVHSWCRKCRNTTQREYRWRNRDRVLKKQREYYNSEQGRATMLRSNLRNRYGITVEAYKNIISSQGGLCLICGRELDGVGVANIDHNHETGVIRGVLCKACNRGLGMFKDNTRLLLKAVLYLDTKIPLALIDREPTYVCPECGVGGAVIPLAEVLKESNNEGS